MEKPKIETPETEILTYFNEVTGRNFRLNNKTYLKGISARFKDGFTAEQMKEVIQVKTLEWKNNPVMSVHLNPETVFRPSNFEKYVNQVVAIKENPQLYAQYFKDINKIPSSAADDDDAISEMYG